ncbi:uncharacterized protein [Physcomitrium patens]|uniref:uncharacterized protein n=1 Tax=Physcomitrium patens TaxID=3218 RepID=UPI000D17AB93|nr:uncharacterized protein LOC112276564 [Physcomitrium patens]|eukprot:XP_024363742.1 uncharacterized protein LOC112276564 [Physcomitrella patens]
MDRDVYVRRRLANSMKSAGAYCKKMKNNPNASQLKGSGATEELLNHTSRSLLGVTMNISSTPTLMGLSDVLEGTSNWLNAQSRSFRGNARWNSERAIKLKLVECLKELESFQSFASEGLQEDDPLQPKDLNDTMFSTSTIQLSQEQNAEP